MSTRRAFVAQGASIGILAPLQALLGNACESSIGVNFEVPGGACDCHTHIYGDPKTFPLSPTRVYTPAPALPEQMRALHKALHIQRVVIVTPSVYGTDNSATLWGMKVRGPDARGVAVINSATSDGEVEAMDQVGVRGVRFNFATLGIKDPSIARQHLDEASPRVASRHWHIQIFTDLAMIAAIKDWVAASQVPVVFDHFGGADAALGPHQPGFASLVELVRSGKAYVKLSAAYGMSTLAPDYPDVVPLARALIAANADRVLWGTDWPHQKGVPPLGRTPTDVAPPLRVDDARLLNLLAVWAPDPAVRKKILVTNPARLYAF